MQVLCYNHKGQLKAYGVKEIYPVGSKVHVQGLLLEDICLVVTEHVSGGQHGLDDEIIVMMVQPVKGCVLTFQKKVSSWFSLGVFGREMLRH